MICPGKAFISGQYILSLGPSFIRRLSFSCDTPDWNTRDIGVDRPSGVDYSKCYAHNLIGCLDVHRPDRDI